MYEVSVIELGKKDDWLCRELWKTKVKRVYKRKLRCSR